jgi:hypothetical protein
LTGWTDEIHLFAPFNCKEQMKGAHGGSIFRHAAFYIRMRRVG